MIRSLLVLGLIGELTAAAAGQVRIFRGVVGAAPAGTVNLPYQATDASGNNWSIYPVGMLQQQGNFQIYTQGAMLTINGAQPSSRRNTARLDEKTGELIMDSLQIGQLQLTRRILVSKEESYVRYVDVLKNPQAQEQAVTLQIQSSFNYGINAAETIEDPRRQGQNIAWVGQTGAGKCALEMFAGKGTRMPPTITYQQGSSQVQASLALTVPAGKEVAVIHLHALVESLEAGKRLVKDLKEHKVLQSLPPEVRKLVANYAATQGYVGDREILRGELFDVVEIRGGDQMKGTLKEKTYKLKTFYGAVELPADRVISILNVGEFRPRQLLVTAEGEVFGGNLSKDSIELELSSGQVTHVPLNQITRMGYRKRSDEAEEWKFDKAHVVLRSGDRVCVEAPASAIDVNTRYGAFKLEPKSVATIAFAAEEHGVHEIYMTDGSRFAGLVNGAEFEMKLAGKTAQVVKFPASTIAKIQISGPVPEIDNASSPTLMLNNEDVLVGTLSGKIRLDTAFDTLQINGPEIKKLTRAGEAPLDVQATLWDSSIVSGQLQEPTLNCQLKSGLRIPVPMSLLQEYNNPQPQPAASMNDRIKALVAELNAEDWKQRDRAAADLTTLGSVVIGTLKELRPSQPPEAQQRIDQILAAVGGKKEK